MSENKEHEDVSKEIDSFLKLPKVVFSTEDSENVVAKLTTNGELTFRERTAIIQLIAEKKNKDSTDEPPQKKRLITQDTQTDELTQDELDEIEANHLMKMSFNKRREQITKHNMITALVKEKYPVLFSRLQISKELDRIFFHGQAQKIITNIKEFAKSIYLIPGDGDPVLRALNNVLSNKVNVIREKKKYAYEVATILLVSNLVHEERNFIVFKYANNYSSKSYVYLKCEAQNEIELFGKTRKIQLFVESTFVCETKDFHEAIMLLLASYFVFNLQFPACNRKTLEFFKKVYVESNYSEIKTVNSYVEGVIRKINRKFTEP